jgi:hypothetical protein
MLIPAHDVSNFGNSFAIRRTLHHRKTAPAPFRSVSWAPFKVGVKTWHDGTRHAFEIARTYTEQYHDERPHHKVTDWKTRLVARCEYITDGGAFYEPLNDFTRSNGYTFPAHV